MSIYSQIKGLQKTPDQGYFAFYFYRKISALISTLFVKLKFHPNFITLLSFFADFLVIYLMYLKLWIIAGLLVNLAIILDLSDGEVARFNRKKQKNLRKKNYGGYLDETVGAISFPLLIFFAGCFMGSAWIGFFAMYGLLMVIITSITGELEFPNKKKINLEFEDKFFKKKHWSILFDSGMHRILVSIAVIFSNLWVLLFFGILCHIYYLSKYWIYRKY